MVLLLTSDLAIIQLLSWPAPFKELILPYLELMAAVVATRVSAHIIGGKIAFPSQIVLYLDTA